MTATPSRAETAIAILGFLFIGALLGISLITWGGPRYARGYCTALSAVVVADTLCVRGDSIVARVQR
jgi:hypothetical protein